MYPAIKTALDVMLPMSNSPNLKRRLSKGLTDFC